MKQHRLLFFALGGLYLPGLLLSAQSYGRLLVSELMADPTPAVGLPGQEYLELYNRSGRPIDLKDWYLEVNGRKSMLPDTLLVPDEFLLVEGLRLPNAGAEIGIWDQQGRLVYGTAYTALAEGPEWKQGGGWAMEWPDPDRICYEEGLWHWSQDVSGGTPGRENSWREAIPDLAAPVFLYASWLGPNDLALQYSEAIRYGFSSGQCLIQPGHLLAYHLSSSIPLGDRLILGFASEGLEAGEAWLTIPGVGDCAGNQAAALRVPIGRPATPGPGDALLSEIMFWPLDHAPEFIELYNPGPGILDLDDLLIDVVKEGEELLHPLSLSSGSRLWPPGGYLLLCPSIASLCRAYDLPRSGSLVELPGWLALSDSGGWILLSDRAGNLVDKAPFGPGMYPDILAENRGVSLERISFERSAGYGDNWHAASSTSGYATPGMPNSQAVGGNAADNWIEGEPQVFSPDNDGYRDVLVLSFSEEVRTCLLSARLFDEQGWPCRTLANNELAGSASRLFWDGKDDEGRLCPEGLYVLLVRAWDPVKGSMRTKRMAIGLVYP
ncbi:MAG: hypothetical protein CSA96_03375 [Bacteroidetes bacterium]|nr:MAG: hypothetical protein CSA96_03375 [Bacteroidota bacterium]